MPTCAVMIVFGTQNYPKQIVCQYTWACLWQVVTTVEDLVLSKDGSSSSLQNHGTHTLDYMMLKLMRLQSKSSLF